MILKTQKELNALIKIHRLTLFENFQVKITTLSYN